MSVARAAAAAGAIALALASLAVPTPDGALAATRKGRGAGSAAAAPAAAAPGAAVIERVEWEKGDGAGRIVVVVRGSVAYEAHVAAADAAAGLPPRAYVDVRPATLGPGVARAPVAVEDGILRRIRVGQFDRQTVRVVVDLGEPAAFEVRTTDRPARLLLSLAPRPPGGAPATVAGSAGAPAEAVAAAPAEAARDRASTSPPEAAGTASWPGEAAPSASGASIPHASTTASEAAKGGERSLGSPARADTADAPAPSAREERAASEPDEVALAAAAPSPTATAEPKLAPVAGASAAAAAPAATAARGRGTRTASGAARRPRVVVLDPGHGGKDPGARGVTGDEEKAITLAIAELVAERLAGDDKLRVVLTRTDDRTVTLEQRTAVANAQGADLFVSIHVNASENLELAGIETYTLNNTNDRATIRLAAMENGLTLAGASSNERDLAYILSDLLQTGKEDESVALAESVHREMLRTLRGRWKTVQSLGVKKGPFYVLVGAYMPCVLVEVGFLTHEVEGQRVASRRYQTDVAEGIAGGIRRFLDSAPANSNL